MFQANVNSQQIGQFRAQGPLPDQQHDQRSGSGIGHNNITFVPGESNVQNPQDCSNRPPLPKGKPVAGWAIKDVGGLHNQLNQSMGETSDSHATFTSLVEDVGQLSIKVQAQLQQLSDDNCRNGARYQNETTLHQQSLKDLKGNCELLAKLQVKVGLLQGANTKKDGEIAGYQMDMKKFTMAVTQATSALSMARSEYNMSEVEHKTETNKLTSQYKEASKLLEELREDCLSAQQSLECSENEVKNLAADNSRLKSENKSLIDDSYESKSRVDGLIKIHREQCRDIKEEIECRREEISILKHNLNRSIKGKERKEIMFNREKAEVGRSREQIRELIQVCEKSQATVRQLETVANKAAENNKNFKDAQWLLKDMSAELTKKTQDLEIAKVCVKDAEGKVLDLETLIESNTASLTSLQELFDRAKGELENKHQELDGLRNELSKIGGDCNQLKDIADAYAAETNRLASTVSFLEDELHRSRSSDHSDRIDKKELQDRLDDAVKDLKSLRVDNDVLSDELYGLIAKNTKLEQELCKLRGGSEGRDVLIEEQNRTIEGQKMSLFRYCAMLGEACDKTGIIKSELEESDDQLQSTIVMFNKHSADLNQALDLLLELSGNKEGVMEKLKSVLESITSDSKALEELNERHNLLKKVHDELAGQPTTPYEGIEHFLTNSTGALLDGRDVESTSDDNEQVRATHRSFKTFEVDDSRLNSLQPGMDYGYTPEMSLDTRLESILNRSVTS